GKRNKIILLTFTIFIIILGTASTLYFLNEYDYDLSKAFGKAEETTLPGEEPTTPVKSKGSSVFLLAGTSTQKDQLYFAALVKIDLKKMQVSVNCMPKDTIVQTSHGSATLEQHFVAGGAVKLTEAAKQYSQAKIDRYVVVGEKNFKQAIKYLGNYSLELNEKIVYNGGDYSLNLVKGKQTLTGDKLLHYIRYQEKQGGAYLNAQSSIICDMIDQMVNENNLDEGEELFNKLINVVDSDISIVDYTKNLNYLKAYVGSDKRQPSVNAELSTFRD
ncbi:MAG: LCP family protein, partial [Oscillospiraceae bacterium]